MIESKKRIGSGTMSGSNITVQRHGAADAFAAAVAARLGDELRHGLERRGRASLIVPGGTTPAPIFDRLAATDLASNSAGWDKVAVSLSDERWVPSSDPASNERLVREHLLTGKAAAAQLVGLYTGAASPGAGQAEAAARLRAMPLPFDAVLLGMGGDGHFASLFPGLPDLAAGLDPEGAADCIACDVPVNGAPRLSLSLALLLRSRVVLLAVKGDDKLAVLQQAETASPLHLPVAALLQQRRVPVEIHWTTT